MENELLLPNSGICELTRKINCAEAVLIKLLSS